MWFQGIIVPCRPGNYKGIFAKSPGGPGPALQREDGFPPGLFLTKM